MANDQKGKLKVKIQDRMGPWNGGHLWGWRHEGALGG